MPSLPPPPGTRPGALPPPPSGGVVASGGKQTEIVVMPDKYYGMALKMEGKTQAELEASMKAPAPAPVAKPVVIAPPAHRPVWPFVALIFLILAIIGGGFVYFNRDTLFQKPPTTVVTPPPPTKPAPNAPANVVAIATTGTAPAVNVTWIDGGGDETGFRVERREADGTFIGLTNLSANSSQFLDPTVRSGRRYEYRVIAIGEGGESSPSSIAVARVEEAAPIPIGPSLPPGGLDSDSDGLSDVEELVFGTDPRVPDSDRDGFLDGNEAFHLYNPAAKAPVRLLDSGLVVAFTGPAGWGLYVPKSFTSTLESTDGSIATIRTGQGEAFRITIEDNPNRQSLGDWYQAKHPTVTTSQLRTITTKGGLEGLLGPDRLDAHFAWDGKIFILKYDLGDKPFINFRTSYEMMLNSLSLTGAPVLVEGAPTPLEGPGEFLQTATSTSSTNP